MWIFFAHDDTQFLTDYKLLLDLKTKPDPAAKQATVLYQYLKESLRFAQTAKEFEIHVLNIYTGTFPLNSTPIITAAEHYWRPLSSDSLTLDDGIQLLASKHPTLADKMNTDVFRRVLAHQGNIPRIWRVFSQLIDELNDPVFDDKELAAFHSKILERVCTVLDLQQLD
jgi:hypothetical protein